MINKCLAYLIMKHIIQYKLDFNMCRLTELEQSQQNISM